MPKSNKSWLGIWKNLIARPNIIAIKKLVAGPAKETFKVPHFWSLKLKGLTGTGFAQPKMGPWPAVAINNNKGNKIVPKGSICFKGFKVKRPASLAVVSPNFKATLP